MINTSPGLEILEWVWDSDSGEYLTVKLKAGKTFCTITLMDGITGTSIDISERSDVELIT